MTQQKIDTCTLKLYDTVGTGTTLCECATLNFVNKNGDYNILLEQLDTILIFLYLCMVCVNIFVLCYLLQIIYFLVFDIVLLATASSIHKNWHRDYRTYGTGTNTIEKESYGTGAVPYHSFVFVYYCNNNLNQLVTVLFS